MGAHQPPARKPKGASSIKQKSALKPHNKTPFKKTSRHAEKNAIAAGPKPFQKHPKLHSPGFKKPSKQTHNDSGVSTHAPIKPGKLENADSRKPSKQNTNNDGKLSSRKLNKKNLMDKRKKHVKPHYELGKEVGAIWEKLRRKNLESDERSSLISAIIEKTKGKVPEMVTSHITSRVVQTCLKYCKPAEKLAIYEELRPHFLVLARNTYAHHLVVKMLDQAKKDQLEQMISVLHGNVVAFLRHPVGCAVVEQAYKLANSAQKQELLAEFYSPEYRLFKGIISKGEHRLIDLLAKEPPSKRTSVLEHMAAALQPILEKGIVDHSIVHRALVEYLSIANKIAAAEILQQLSGPLLIRMLHTKDGAQLGVFCVGASKRKERKKIIKGLKGNVMKVACDQHGSVVLLAILDATDDTELANKFVISELVKDVKEMILNKYGRRFILHLLSPYDARYLSTDVLTALQRLSTFSDQADKQKEDEGDNGEEMREGKTVVGRKDPLKRRIELLNSSALAEKLVEVCCSHAGELLRSPLGKDVIYEVARGGADGIMWHCTPNGISSVHKAIADLAAQPRVSADAGQTPAEHVFEHYHSSRTIRSLILDQSVAPECITTSSFSSVLWRTALKGKCKQWASGHSEKVVSAFQQCKDVKIKQAAMMELQPLLDSGLLQNRLGIAKSEGTKRKRHSKTQ